MSRALVLLATGSVVACSASGLEREKALEAVVSAQRLQRGGEPARARELLEAARNTCREARNAECEALVLVGLGEHHAATGSPDEARGECEHARDQLRKRGDAQGEALAESCLAGAQLARSAFSDAEHAAAAGQVLARKAGDRRAAGWCVARRGYALWRMGDTSGARRVLDAAAAERGGDTVAAAEIARVAASVRSALGEKREALGAMREVLSTFRAHGDRAGEASALTNIGGVLADLGERREALAAYAKALPLRRTVGDRAGEGATLSNTGLVYSDTGDARRAIEYHQQALPVRHDAGDRSGEASTLNNPGIAWASLGDLHQALDYYQRALAAFRAIADRSGESGTLNNLGGLYARLGEKRKSLEYFTQTLPILRAIGDRPGEAVTLNNIGLVHADLGEKEQALARYQESLAILRAVGDRAGEGRTLNNIGLTWAELGDSERALAFYRQALPVRRAASDRVGEASTLNNIGILNANRGETDQALEHYTQAIAAFHAAGDRASEASALNNVGLIHAARPSRVEKRQALDHYQQALSVFRAVGDRTGEARALTNIGVVHADLGHRTEALLHYVRALPIRRAVGDRTGEAVTLTNAARILATAAPAQAIVHAKQAVNLYQALRADIRGLDREVQRGYARTVAGAYRLLADLLAARGRLGEAQRVIELLKDQEFFEFVRRDTREVAGEPVPLRPGEESAARRYDELAAPITRLGAEWGALQRKESRTPDEDARFAALDHQLEEANAAFVAFLGGMNAELARSKSAHLPRIDDISSGVANALDRMEPGTVAVFTLAGERNLRTILVTSQVRKGYSPKPAMGAAALGRAVMALRQALQNPRLDPRPAARKLHDALVKPMAADLAGAGAKTILWFLDGPLRYLPMAALHDGKRWLAEQYASVVISGESLTELEATPRATWNALAFGVTAAHDGFAALPGVTAEVSALVGDGNTPGVLPGKRLLDGEFTDAALADAVRQRPAVIHVASHFAFKPGDEAQSFLLLGDGKHLTLGDLRLRPRIFAGVDLLALSACETAVEGGEGTEVDGLGRIAQKKGAAAVLATLWPVSDASTPAVMRRFYSLREARKLTKAEALREAQCDLIAGRATPGSAAPGERGVARLDGGGPSAGTGGARAMPGWSHPYYWAPFILLGNGR